MRDGSNYYYYFSSFFLFSIQVQMRKQSNLMQSSCSLKKSIDICIKAGRKPCLFMIRRMKHVHVYVLYLYIYIDDSQKKPMKHQYYKWMSSSSSLLLRSYTIRNEFSLIHMNHFMINNEHSCCPLMHLSFSYRLMKQFCLCLWGVWNEQTDWFNHKYKRLLLLANQIKII